MFTEVSRRSRVKLGGFVKCRRRSCLLKCIKCIKCNRQATCIRQRPCLYKGDGGQVYLPA